MKYNRLMWLLVLLFVCVTVAVTWINGNKGLGDIYAASPSSTPPNAPQERDWSKFGSVRYDGELPANAEGDRRREINRRYDGLEWVYKVINNPRTAGVGRITHDDPPPLFPAEKSFAIVTGKVIRADTFLSNDREGVYTEFTIRVEEVLKGSDSIQTGASLKADREGGVVVYPNGQRVLYQSSQKGLPQLGHDYLFFLAQDDLSPNLSILTSYQLDEINVGQMEFGRPFEQFKGAKKVEFLEEVRKKVANKKNQ